MSWERQLEQEHLGIYYYVESRNYGMYMLQATAIPVLSCVSAGKLTFRSPTTAIFFHYFPHGTSDGVCMVVLGSLVQVMMR